MTHVMTDDERRAFLADGTRTAILATIRDDGRPHAVPVWYAVAGDDVLINTSEESVKAKALRRDPRVALVVDDDSPPYAFVMVEGVAEISRDPDEVRQGTTEIGRRYLGAEGAAEFVRYATGPGKVIVRVRPTRVVAHDRVAG